jgi:hypothetical protein
MKYVTYAYQSLKAYASALYKFYDYQTKEYEKYQYINIEVFC